MNMVFFFALLLCAATFVVFLGITIYSVIKRKSWKKNAYISGGLLVATFLLFVFFGTSITDEDKVMSEQMSTIQAQESDLNEHESKIVDLEAEIDKLNATIEEYSQNDTSEDDEKLTATIASLEKSIEEKDEEIEKLSKSSKDSKELSSENKKLTSEIEDLKKSNEDLSKEIETLSAESEKEEKTSETEDEAEDPSEEKEDETEVSADEKESPEQSIEDAVNEANRNVKSVDIEKDGDLYQPNIVIDGSGYLWAIDASAKGDITDVVYALKESKYEYGFINIVVEMEFIDTYGNEKISTGYEAEFTQEILDKLTDEKYMIMDKIDQTANYWFKHPGIE